MLPDLDGGVLRAGLVGGGYDLGEAMNEIRDHFREHIVVLRLNYLLDGTVMFAIGFATAVLLTCWT